MKADSVICRPSRSVAVTVSLLALAGIFVLSVTAFCLLSSQPPNSTVTTFCLNSLIPVSRKLRTISVSVSRKISQSLFDSAGLDGRSLRLPSSDDQSGQQGRLGAQEISGGEERLDGKPFLHDGEGQNKQPDPSKFPHWRPWHCVRHKPFVTVTRRGCSLAGGLDSGNCSSSIRGSSNSSIDSQSSSDSQSSTGSSSSSVGNSHSSSFPSMKSFPISSTSVPSSSSSSSSSIASSSMASSNIVSDIDMPLVHLLLLHAATVYSEDTASLHAWNCSQCVLPEMRSFHLFQIIVEPNARLQAYVGWDPPSRLIIVAFRGTCTSSLRNWIADLEALPRSLSYPNLRHARVHRGFYSAYHFTRLRPAVVHAVLFLMTILPGSYRVAFTGHSLGAALATLSALDLQVSYDLPSPAIRVVTFGSPRVGNAAFAAYFRQKVPGSTRVTNWKDLVPHLPPATIGYHHVATEAWIVPDSLHNVSFSSSSSA